jgi:hypothetical protein
MAIFSTLYGEWLSQELGSSDTSVLFTTQRRKDAINEGQKEFNERTECFQRQRPIPIVSGTQEYDVIGTLTDFSRVAKAGVFLSLFDGTNTRTVAGITDFPQRSEQWLDQNEPGWRTVTGQPTSWYLRRSGGQIFLGFNVAPSVPAGSTWTAYVNYVAFPPDLSGDTDQPYTLSGAILSDLATYHRALAHWAAGILEDLRKETERKKLQLSLFETYVAKYRGDDPPKGGNPIRFSRRYLGERRRPAGSGFTVTTPDPTRYP